MHFKKLILAPLALSSLLWLSACGGGSTTASNGSGIGSGGTGSYTTGSISGFGSIIVNGVRYDNSSVGTVSLDGDSSTSLALGMVVTVSGGATSTSASGQTVAQADSVQVGYELLGPLPSANVDVANSQITLLGQTVKITADTFYDDNNTQGISGLGASGCELVKVYGFPSDSGYTATRVECLAQGTFEGYNDARETYRVRGKVSAANSASVTINNQAYSLGMGVSAPAVGSFVRLRLAPTGASSPWTVVRVSGETRSFSERREGRAEGLVAHYSVSGSSGSFDINGVPVQFSSSTRREPTSLNLSNGVRVEVEGSIQNGVLVASKISLETDSNEGPGDTEGTREIELHGTIRAGSIDTTLNTLKLRIYNGTDINIRWADAQTQFDLGAADNSETGLGSVGNRVIEVKGVRDRTGSVVLATKIKTE